MERVTDKQYWMDNYLKTNLDTIDYNLTKDWDFVIPISGSGMVRVGKSVLAQQVGYYIAWKRQTPFTVDNIVFSGEELMKIASKLPKNSVIIYDEARGELDSKKTMESVTKSLLDFFAECGMYNHCIILVLPNFFELPKSIAIYRTDILLNVLKLTEEKTLPNGTVVIEYKRGFYEFFNRQSKKKLYIEGKKRYDDYTAAKRSFYGEFRNFDIIDRDAYEQKKLNFLKRDRVKKNKKGDERFLKTLRAFCSVHTQEEVSELLKVQGLKLSNTRISQLVNEKLEEETILV